MTTLVFDIETNGLLDELDRLHCLCIKNLDTGEVISASSENLDIKDTIAQHLMKADVLIGHNILKFDIPAIQKVYPWFKPKAEIRDTLIMARLIYPEIANMDYGPAQAGTFPKKLIGRYSLEAFGYRIGEYKGDYKGGWDQWSQEMQDYCEQDIEVTTKLYHKLMERKEKHNFSDYSIELEHKVAEIIFRQEQNGFGFDMGKAEVLYQELLVRRIELERELKQMFPPWEVKTPFVPKVNNKTRGYVKGQMTYKVQVVEFNPSSRHHIAKVLKEKHGWEPKEFTEKGEAKVDDSVLAELDYPEAKLLAEYFLIQKRLGQLAEGGEGLMKRVKKDGRIHGEVITNGAVTGRMTHRKPNMAQIPANRSPYGDRFRDLFKARDGWVLVGCDADALELRCLAHYMSAFDHGEYVDVVLKGDKSKGTDMHSVNCRAIGLDPATHRDIAKTFFYAFIYGAGNHKIGSIVGSGSDTALLKLGAKTRRNFLKNLPALGKLTERVAEKVGEKGALKGIDGRRLSCRSAHSALNTLLQSAGAVAMKVALVILDDDLKARGYRPGADYEFVANVHDEWQIECREQVAEVVGKTAADAIRKAGETLGFKCPLAGNYEIGRTWKETH